MEEDILTFETTSIDKVTERAVDGKEKYPQSLHPTILAAMSTELAAGNHSEPSRAKANKRQSDRGGISNDFLERLVYISKRKAVETHALLEKKRAKNPYGGTSRATTPRQISNKNSAELCRLQKQTYTKILETRLSELIAYNDRTRRMMTALSLETSRASMRLFELSGQTQSSVAEKNKIEIFAKSAPLTVSRMTNMESDSHTLNKNVMDDCVQQSVYTPNATSGTVTNDDMGSLVNGNHALLPLSPTVNKLLTRHSSGIMYSPTMTSQNKLSENEAFFTWQQEESKAATAEREEQPGENISNIHFGEISPHQELDIFLSPLPLEPSPCDFDNSFNFES